MKTLTTLTNLATSLSQNTTPANATLMQQLMNDQHRYLIEKYFDNERSVQTSTVGSMSLTLTTTLALGAVSGTLTASWAYPTVSQLVNFSNGNQRLVRFTNGSTAVTWPIGLTGSVTASISSVGVEAYNIPSNVSKIKNATISVGQLKYQMIPIMSRQEWDTVNFLPYNSDIPNYLFIYNGKMEVFPIPSTTGNIIQFNYKSRVADLSYADYTTGTLAAAGMVAGSVTVTGTATGWTAYPQNTDLTFQNLFIKADPSTGGDGIWYQIQSFTSATTLVLVNPIVNAPSITTATTYTIGQMPVLSEDFHDMLPYGALMIYFSTIVKDPNKYAQFEKEYEKRMSLLEDYAGTKSVNVDLEAEPNQVNPNLFLYANQ